MLQFHIAQESQKFGLDMASAEALLTSKDYQEMKHVQVCGVMGMATFTSNMNQVGKEFQQLADYFDQLKQKFFKLDHAFHEKSMGMTNDFHEAITHGSTMVRIGSAIFGERIYN